MNILKTENLCKNYGEGDQKVTALNSVNITVKEGEFVAVVGTSGSGKSTLLHMLGGLDQPTSGNVYIKDKDISTLSAQECTVFRRRNIGFIFQSYNLVESLTVYENIILPMGLDGRDVDRGYFDKIVKVLGLNQKLDRFPTQLSGGQQQRVAIARALVTKPAVILADEPTGNLDSYNSTEVVKLLKHSGEEFGQTILMITHNEQLAEMTDRIIQIEDGKIKAGAAYEE